MKYQFDKYLKLAIFCLIILFHSTNSPAVEFSVKGQWVASFGYGANGNFEGGYKNHHTIGWGRGQDNFEALQKFTLQFDVKANEKLSGSLSLVMGDVYWGQASTGGPLGTDSRIVQVETAFIDWEIGKNTLMTRLGLQNIALPAFASGNSVLNGQTASAATSIKLSDWLSITAFWARPYNDNYQGYNASSQEGPSNFQANYLDNVDAFGLMFPFNHDTFRLTPWFMYAMLGPNTFRNGKSVYPFGNLNDNTSGDSSYYMAGMFPAGGARHKNFTNANGSRHVTEYGNAWWSGITGRGTLFDMTAAFDFEYGKVVWNDDGRLDRSGWFGALLLEYALDWGVPGIYGWYGSGDDANPANGSERLPSIDANNSNNFSFFAFDGSPYLERNAVIGNNMAGTWGVGARVNHLSIIDRLTHKICINYIRGTNSPAMAKKMSMAGLWSNGSLLVPNNLREGSGLGLESMYLTTLDSALELGAINSYSLAENFKINLEAAYIFLFLDTGNSVWGARHRKGQSIPSTKDAWNTNLCFVYTF